MQSRMAKASATFGRLRQRLWNTYQDKIYRAIVLSTLLYVAEAWTVYRRQVRKLHAFMMRHLRSIMRITWMDKMTNKEILEHQGCHLWKIFWSERISGGLDTLWGCHQTGYQSRFSILNCLLVTGREGALVSGSRIPSRETWSWETRRPTHGHHSHSREINGEQ